MERSALTLKLLSHSETGAFVAAPTTSLPEWPGGGRNWDYRYVWIRDAAFASKVMILDGHVTEARAFLRWALERSHRRSGEKLRVLYGVHGETDLKERVLPHLEGFLSSRPVWVGNGAEDQFQLDIYGTLINVVHMMSEIDGPLINSEWPHIAGLADEVMRVWRRPDRGLWEMRTPSAHYVHSKLMAWVALDRATNLARKFGTREEGRWSTEAEVIRAEILDRGYDRETHSFVQAFERPVADASTLRIPLVGFLPFHDPKVLGTVDRIRKELSDGPFVYRYRAPDGFEEPEGAFLLCSFWLIENLARSGRIEEARANWDALMAAASPLGLFSEEFDPKGRRPLGNYPQAFTHIGVLRAGMAIGRALEGRVEPLTTVHIRSP